MSLVCWYAGNGNHTTEEVKLVLNRPSVIEYEARFLIVRNTNLQKRWFIMLDLLLHGGLDIWKQQLSTTIHTIDSDSAHHGVKTKTL